ncbi:MAG: hypothetical protein KDC12_05285 [Flavobacteriales bacterium]|nr:hypothetical protein [Flavobacteriales bacterium]
MALDSTPYVDNKASGVKQLRQNSTFRLSIQHPDTRNKPPQYFSGNRGNFWEYTAPNGATCEVNRCMNSDLFDPHPFDPNDVHSENYEETHYRWMCDNAASLDRLSINNETSKLALTCGPYNFGQTSMQGWNFPPPSKPSSGSGDPQDMKNNNMKVILVGGISEKISGLPSATNGGIFTLRTSQATATVFREPEHYKWGFVTPYDNSTMASGLASIEVLQNLDQDKFPVNVQDYGISDGNRVMIRIKGEDGKWYYLRGNQQSSHDEDGYYTVLTSKLPDTLEKWEKVGWEYMWKVEILNVEWFGGDPK